MSISAVAAKPGGLTLPGLLLAGLLILIGLQTEVIRLPGFGVARPAGPQTVLITPRPFAYRASGDFLREAASIDGPLLHVAHPAELEIMTYQVSAADYAMCVTEGACERAEPRRRGTGNVPVTGVSFNDANDYAVWLSHRTGQTWRLPTVEEWAFAAGGKAVDHALGVETDGLDPAERWLLQYERQAALGDDAIARPVPIGTFGTNEFGVADLSEVVWEWTATCASRTTVSSTGEVLNHVENCGVRYLEGRHRTPMSAFVRDAVGGGCSVGVPPDNLGFRLVREPQGLERAVRTIRNWLQGA